MKNYSIITEAAGRKHVLSDTEICQVLAMLPIPEAAEWQRKIEELRERGTRYSNEDFDVLSGALSLLWKNMPRLTPEMADKLFLTNGPAEPALAA